MMKTNWQRRRIEFNHDWMKNNYIQALRSWLRLLCDDNVVYRMLEKTFISDTLPQWEDHLDEAFRLPKDFEVEMSPRILFTEPPLSRCENEIKNCLCELIHALWVKRYSVDTLVDDALKKAENTRRAYNNLQAALKMCPDTKNIQEIKPIKPLFEDFCSCCQGLAVAIEKFPSEIKAV